MATQHDLFQKWNTHKHDLTRVLVQSNSATSIKDDRELLCFIVIRICSNAILDHSECWGNMTQLVKTDAYRNVCGRICVFFLCVDPYGPSQRKISGNVKQRIHQSDLWCHVETQTLFYSLKCLVFHIVTHLVFKLSLSILSSMSWNEVGHTASLWSLYLMCLSQSCPQ